MLFDDIIRKLLPLTIPFLMAFFSAIASLASNAEDILKVKPEDRGKKVGSLLVRKIPLGLCLSSISFDIWAITSLQTLDTKSLQFYSLDTKRNLIAPLLLFHLVLYLFALLWEGINGDQKRGWLYPGAIIAILSCLCVLFL